MKCDYYVYVYFRQTGSPCYVGKGRGRRCSRHNTRTHNRHLAAIIAKDGALPFVIVRDGLTNEDAILIEVALIKAIGRKANGGPLVNQTDGGDGSPGSSRKGTISEAGRTKLKSLHTAKIVSEETRQKQRERALLNGSKPPSRKGMPSPNRGKTVSLAQREKISASLMMFNALKKTPSDQPPA